MQGLKERSFLRCREGVSAIEFALLAPLFFLLIFGIVEFSLIMFTATAIESATQQGARTGKTGYLDPNAVGDDGQQIEERKKWIREKIKGSLNELINDESLVINTRILPSMNNIPPGAGDSQGTVGQGGEVVEYTVLYKWPIQTPLVKNAVSQDDDGTFNIITTVIVQNEPFGTAAP